MPHTQESIAKMLASRVANKKAKEADVSLRTSKKRLKGPDLSTRVKTAIVMLKQEERLIKHKTLLQATASDLCVMAVLRVLSEK